jgi:hypothetical protein
LPEELSAAWGELGLFSLKRLHGERAKLGDAVRQDHAILVREPADLMDQGRLGFHEPFVDPMQGLEVLRLDPFDRDNAHRGPGDGFTDGFRIAGLLLRRLDIRVDESRRDQPHVMTMLAETSGPSVSTPTGFHPHAERRQMGNKTRQFTAREALAECHMPGIIHADDVNYEVGDIDPKYTDRLCHRTRLLWLNSGP